jgi:predicted HNH restriction endonuclease
MKYQSMSQVKAEVDKCIAVCANCHRIIHQKQRIRKERPPSNEIARDRQRWYSQMKAAQICSVCGQTFPDYPSVIEFHHKGDSKKEGGIASMATRMVVPLGQVQAEITKCIVVCANCHRIVHDLERKKKAGLEKSP